MHLMMHRLAPLFTVAAALISSAFATSALANPVARLSAPEYQQLLVAHSHLLTVRPTTVKGLSTAVHVCEQIPQLSPLLNLERSRCIYSIDLARTGSQLESTDRSCSKQTTANQIGCVLPSYQAMRSAALGLVQAERETETDVRSRGFSGVCARALRSKPRLIAKEAKVALDLAHLIKAMRARNATATRIDATHVITDTAAEASDQITHPSSLSACPHAVA
jgi:hypothetical protein